MINQALKLSKIKKNVVVKIPITFTNGKYTTHVIEKLILNKVKLNITAVFNLIQVKKIYRVIKKSDIIVYVFAGRIHDMGVDAEKEINKINNFLKKNKSKARVLWASTRQVYDFKQAKNSKCSIITMSPGIYDKLKFLNYGWKKFSLDTVKQFFYDASKSKFKI